MKGLELGQMVSAAYATKLMADLGADVIKVEVAHVPHGVRKAAPVLGADTDAVLREVLGYAEAEISKLKDQEVLY